MFSRYRMNPIVEIQGSDWDWLRLRYGAEHVEEGRGKEKVKGLTGIQFRTIDSSYYWVQLPA